MLKRKEIESLMEEYLELHKLYDTLYKQTHDYYYKEISIMYEGRVSALFMVLNA